MLNVDHPDTTGKTPAAIRAMIEEREATHRAMRRGGAHRTRREEYEGLGRAIDFLHTRLGELTRGPRDYGGAARPRPPSEERVMGDDPVANCR